MKVHDPRAIQRQVLHWQSAPRKTEWGGGMLSATVALSKDETLDIYAHEDAIHLVLPALDRLVNGRSDEPAPA